VRANSSPIAWRSPPRRRARRNTTGRARLQGCTPPPAAPKKSARADVAVEKEPCFQVPASRASNHERPTLRTSAPLFGESTPLYGGSAPKRQHHSIAPARGCCRSGKMHRGRRAYRTRRQRPRCGSKEPRQRQLVISPCRPHIPWEGRCALRRCESTKWSPIQHR